MPLTSVSTVGRRAYCLPFPRRKILRWDVELLVSVFVECMCVDNVIDDDDDDDDGVA